MSRFANFARSRLAAYLPADGAELTVENASAFPEGSFTAVIWEKGFASPADDANREIVLAEKAEDTITIERGRENTAAKDWNTGSLIANVITAGLLNSLSASVNVRTISADGETISPNDSLVVFSFAENGMISTCQLPEQALFNGKMLTLVNCGTESSLAVRIFAAEGDSIGLRGDTQIILGSACSITMTACDGMWQISGTGLFSPHSFQTVNTSGLLNASGCVVYADASMYPLYLFIPDNGAMANVPTLIIKTDATSNKVLLHDPEGYNFVTLKQEGEAAFVLRTDSGNVINLAMGGGGGSSSGGGYSVVTGYYVLETGMSYLFANSSYGYAYVELGNPAEHAGQAVTVIRTDATESPVMVSKSAEPDFYLTAEGESLTFVCSGTAWYRTA